VYHIELRQFPHNFSHFNLTAQALQETVLDAWARDQWVEVGERRWNPHQATLTVIEGPELPLEQLSMGRGWRNALRQGTDVTSDVLAEARLRLGVADPDPFASGSSKHPAAGAPKSAWAALTGPSRGTPGGTPGGSGQQGGAARGAEAAGSRTRRPAGSSDTGDQPQIEQALAQQLLALLGRNPEPLLRAWQLASEQHPDRTPSQCLAAAEDFVRR